MVYETREPDPEQDELADIRHLGNPAFLREVQRLLDTHVAKAAGYSGSDHPDTWANFREADAWGLTPLEGCLVRMGDKYRRIQNLRRNAANDRVGESIKDTLRDLANYAIIALCLMEEEEQAELIAKANQVMETVELELKQESELIDLERATRSFSEWLRTLDKPGIQYEPNTDLKTWIVMKIGEELELCIDNDHALGIHPHIYAGAGVVVSAARFGEVK